MMRPIQISRREFLAVAAGARKSAPALPTWETIGYWASRLDENWDSKCAERRPSFPKAIVDRKPPACAEGFCLYSRVQLTC